MKNKQIIFTKVNTAELCEIETNEPSDNQLVVETVFSAISCGTEKANITGDPSVNINSDSNVKSFFPRYLGYSGSGIVKQIGKNVQNFKVGDRVAMTWSFHSKINVIDQKNVVKIENNNVSFEDAALSHIATFPLAAIRKTRLEIGESMLIMGLGILGLMAVQYAKAAGAAPVIAVDPIAQRREKALSFGADFALDPLDEDFSKRVKELTDGGANTAIEVTGIGAGLDQCLDCMAKFGRVALLGCTRDKNFTIDYYRKVHGPGIQLIGAHTLARPEHESHPGYFTKNDDLKVALKLCALNRVSLKKMIDEIQNPQNCTEVYTRLVNDKNFPVTVLFDWRSLS